MSEFPKEIWVLGYGRTEKRMSARHAPRPIWLTEQTVQAWGRGLFATITDPRNRDVFKYIFGG